MSIKNSNEITVKIKGSLEEFQKYLEEKEYAKQYSFSLEDTFFVPVNLDIENLSVREILANAVLTRYITRDGKTSGRLTFKKKDINEAGEILSQEAINCEVKDIQEAKKFLEAIGYKEIMTIKENDVAYEKDGFSLETKDIIDGDVLIEIETCEDERYNTIEKIKEKIDEEKIPIYKDNFFVKKAEVRLSKILGRK